MSRLTLATLVLACWTAAGTVPGAAADLAASKDAPVKEVAKEAARVEVKASAADYDPRRDDTASKTVMNKDEIMKYGDINVFDVLKRAPGVTVAGTSIRMRGLGGGYTQVLVNGQRPPPGFSLEALAPDQIERIEIVRAAMAEFSMRAIAGTINIVLKTVATKAERSVRMAATRSAQKNGPFVNASRTDIHGDWSWVVNATVQYNHAAQDSMLEDRGAAADGAVTQWRERTAAFDAGSGSAALQPRLVWKPSADHQLGLSGTAQWTRGGSANTMLTDNLVGTFPAPDYVHGRGRQDYRSRFGYLAFDWTAKIWGGKLEASASRSDSRFDSRTDWLGGTVDDAVQLRRQRDSGTRSVRSGSNGKFTRSVFDGHALAAGWSVTRSAVGDDEHRVEGQAGAAPDDIRERFTPRVRELAAYAQDEWNVTRHWSMYVGARWEGIRTDSGGTGLPDTGSATRVLAPVAQTLYKFPDKSGRQLRLALARTFKAPDTGQLGARRYHATLNTRFTPDSSGNPDLRPELARGIDLTYEHFWAPGAMFALGASERRIHDIIRRVLAQDAGGLWLTRPINDGDAVVRTLDFDAKLPLKAVLPAGAPPVDLRFSVNRNWSRVEAVPGPDNRLDQQIPFSATFGADYRKDTFGMGVSLACRAGGNVRMSREESTHLQARRDVDAYVQVTPRKGLDLRLSLANALGEDTLEESRYQDAAGTSATWSRRPASPELRLNLSIKR
jgi:outer membrane receptor for ferrienterochelin and colicin